jgi:hypothetical protein
VYAVPSVIGNDASVAPPPPEVAPTMFVRIPPAPPPAEFPPPPAPITRYSTVGVTMIGKLPPILAFTCLSSVQIPEAEEEEGKSGIRRLYSPKQ